MLCVAAVSKLAHLLGVQPCPRGLRAKVQRDANQAEVRKAVVFFSSLEDHSNSVFWREMDCISVVCRPLKFLFLRSSSSQAPLDSPRTIMHEQRLCVPCTCAPMEVLLMLLSPRHRNSHVAWLTLTEKQCTHIWRPGVGVIKIQHWQS